MHLSLPKKLILAVAAAALLALGAAVAGAAVTIYNTDFSSASESREIERSGGGNRCERNYRKKQKAMHAAVKGGPTTCSFRPPVIGDGELPNHDVVVEGKILKKTDKSVRGGAFLEVGVREGGGGVGYVLRVFPKRKRFELTRGPRGNGFPVSDKSEAIKAINERNELRLSAHGAEVRAFVNGEQVAKVTDDNPGQVTGRKIRFAVGNQKDKQGSVVATFKRVAVSVPSP